MKPSFMIAPTLVISGSLSEQAVCTFLSSSLAQNCIVVEFDTMLEQRQFPKVAHWYNYSSFVSSTTAAQELNDCTRNVLAAFLQARPESGELTGDELLRRAALRAQDWQVAVPRFLNDLIFQKIQAKHTLGGILVAAGSGISFDGWRRTAKDAALPIDFLSVELPSYNLARRLEKWRGRWMRRSERSTVRNQTVELPTVIGQADVLCCSERVMQIFANQKQCTTFAMKFTNVAALGEPSIEELRPWINHYEQWWLRWQALYINANKEEEALAHLRYYKEIPLSLGKAYVPSRYARFAALRERALQVLKKERPRMLLTDTQTDNEDRAWSLAAVALGIPVVSYTYDHFVDSKLCFVPDHLLADGACSISAATRHGYPDERIIDVRSHRKPTGYRRDDSEINSKLCAPRPQLLFADSYHAAWSAHSDPRGWLTQYQQLVEAARLIPNADFLIKFHPLRSKKQEALAFAGMDEQELHVRKRFLRKLRAPSNLRLLAPEFDMTKCLEDVAILLNTTSSVGLHAFHFGIPVIFLTHPDALFWGYPDIHKFMNVLCTNDGISLADKINKLLNEPSDVLARIKSQRRYIDDYYWHSTKTLADGVLEIFRSIQPNTTKVS